MDHLEAAGLVARDRGCEVWPGTVVLRPRTATVIFTPPDGRREVMTYDELIAEGERLRAEARGGSTPRGRWKIFSFEYDSPIPGGRR